MRRAGNGNLSLDLGLMGSLPRSRYATWIGGWLAGATDLEEDVIFEDALDRLQQIGAERQAVL